MVAMATARCVGNGVKAMSPTNHLGIDQVIRENPAGTETSAEVLVGPPWRMESNRRSTAVVLQ